MLRIRKENEGMQVSRSMHGFETKRRVALSLILLAKKAASKGRPAVIERTKDFLAGRLFAWNIYALGKVLRGNVQGSKGLYFSDGTWKVRLVARRMTRYTCVVPTLKTAKSIREYTCSLSLSHPSLSLSLTQSSSPWAVLKPKNICGNANFIFHTPQPGYMVPPYLKIYIMAPWHVYVHTQQPHESTNRARKRGLLAKEI